MCGTTPRATHQLLPEVGVQLRPVGASQQYYVYSARVQRLAQFAHYRQERPPRDKIAHPVALMEEYVGAIVLAVFGGGPAGADEGERARTHCSLPSQRRANTGGEVSLQCTHSWYVGLTSTHTSFYPAPSAPSMHVCTSPSPSSGTNAEALGCIRHHFISLGPSGAGDSGEEQVMFEPFWSTSHRLPLTLQWTTSPCSRQLLR